MSTSQPSLLRLGYWLEIMIVIIAMTQELPSQDIPVSTAIWEILTGVVSVNCYHKPTIGRPTIYVTSGQ